MNGILIVNKPKGCTSRDVINFLNKKFNTKRIGHTGTLDPIATGVLVVTIGNALKISELLTSTKKEYVARVILGYETDMLDITGKETKRNIPHVSKAKVEEVLKSFIGKQKQEVPLYSAVKVGGRKLYEYARNNIPVTPPIKDIEVHSLSLEGDITYLGNTIEFTIKTEVSKGTYIRSLIRDIGRKLGTYATMKELERTRQGNFDIANSYTIQDIENDNYKLLSINESLPELEVTILDDNMLKKVKNGQVLDNFFKEEISLLVDKNNNPIAIYKKIENGKVKPYKMFEV